MRPAAVDDDRVYPHGLEEDDIFGKIARGLSITHRVAAVFDDERLPGIALHVGQRLGKRLCLGEEGWIRRVARHAAASSRSSLRPNHTAAWIRIGTMMIESTIFAMIALMSSGVIGKTP